MHPIVAFTALERACPSYVDPGDWRQAIADGRRFLIEWAEQVSLFGWTAEELFGLHEPPERPFREYRRLRRHDCTGLVWILHGRPVTALTANAATIATHSGGRLTFYRHPSAT